MKLHSTSFREQEGRYFIDYYGSEKPKFQSLFVGHLSNKDYAYSQAVLWWQQSKQSIEVHPSQVEGFKVLANTYNFSSDPFIIKQGIQLPDDMVEIREVPVKHDLPIKYAFLKQETKPSVEEERSQDELLLTECLETISKLRPNNAGLGVLQHKLKVRLNKF